MILAIRLRVLFMSEVLTLIDKHDNKLNVVVHYDTMSGVTFCSDVPGQFNHGDEHLSSEDLATYAELITRHVNRHIVPDYARDADVIHEDQNVVT